MEELTMILGSILGFCVMFHFLAHYFKPYSRLKMLKDAKRILIITSHPDDETMFFGPTILSLCRKVKFSIKESVSFVHVHRGSQKYRNKKKTRAL